MRISSVYHPQTDGQSEALNKCLEMYLRCFVSENPHLWVSFLPWAELWYNSSFQTSIGWLHSIFYMVETLQPSFQVLSVMIHPSMFMFSWCSETVYLLNWKAIYESPNCIWKWKLIGSELRLCSKLVILFLWSCNLTGSILCVFNATKSCPYAILVPLRF